jgi:hypothetical protein
VLLALAFLGTALSFGFYESRASWLALGVGLVPMHFCVVDAENEIARQLVLEHVGGVAFMMAPLGYGQDTVLPTVLMVDPEGILVYADLSDNYRVRPVPSTFLAALDAGA